jgi:FAD/FMN-containing dehydrogenase
VLALGALGVVTALTLDVRPTFDVRQTVHEGLPLDAAGEALAAAYSVSLFTYWEGARPSTRRTPPCALTPVRRAMITESGT